MKADTDYEVTYADNTDAGTAAVTVTGKGAYEGSASVSFTIHAKEFTASDLPAIDIPNQKEGTANDTLIGSAVTWGENSLREDADYDVTCDNSKSGSKTAVFTFKGNCSGKASRNYDVAENTIDEAG